MSYHQRRRRPIMEFRTPNVTLIPKTRDQVLAWLAEMHVEQRAQVSPLWLARVQAMTTPDPWTLGFSVFHRGLDIVVGGCGFKGPPNKDGIVEIAFRSGPDQVSLPLCGTGDRF